MRNNLWLKFFQNKSHVRHHLIYCSSDSYFLRVHLYLLVWSLVQSLHTLFKIWHIKSDHQSAHFAPELCLVLVWYVSIHNYIIFIIRIILCINRCVVFYLTLGEWVFDRHLYHSRIFVQARTTSSYMISPCNYNWSERHINKSIPLQHSHWFLSHSLRN